MVPAKFDVVIVAACETHQTTLHGWLPPAITTERFVPVSAPVPSVPILKLQMPLDGSFSVSVPVRAAAAGKQYEPGASVTPASVPERTVQASAGSGASAAYVSRKPLN